MAKKNGELTNEEITKSEQYWKDARHYVKLNSDDPENPAWVLLKRDDARLPAWRNYWAWRLGFQPAGIHYLQTGAIQHIFVPANLPELFDETYPKRGSYADAR
jgi:hypothetical protein